MHIRVRVAAIAYTAGAVGLMTALAATALAAGHPLAPDGSLAFRPVTVPPAAPSALPAGTVPPIYDVAVDAPSHALPSRPPIAAPAASVKKPRPKPKVHHAARHSVPSTRTARAYARRRLGATQFGCLDRLWTKESGWNRFARNPSSGAYGIPQALPGSKMATVAGDWRYNPLTQVRWGLGYISAAYGTACRAWSHSERYDWY